MSKPPFEKWSILSLVAFTIVALLVGIVLIIAAKLLPIDKTISEIIFALGVTLVSASTIGILTEIFLQYMLAKKMLSLENNFLAGIIPQVMDSVYEWINVKGRKIPIEKSTLYNLINIGYRQWFMKENFHSVGISSEQVSELYQKLQLNEFKEPICTDFTITLTYMGPIEPSIVKRNDLINVKTLIEFYAINTSNDEHIEDRYINRNGILVDFYVDIFEDFPKNESDKAAFRNRIEAKFRIYLEHELKACEIEFVAADYVKYLSSVKQMEAEEISKLIKTLTLKDVEPLANKVYILYHFFENPSPEVNGFMYVIFCPYPIKPQERLRISYERIHAFAESDFFYTHLKSLSRGFTLQLIGFDSTHVTAISEFLLRDQPVAKHTNNLLTTSSLLLPRSAFIASWQKKTSPTV